MGMIKHGLALVMSLLLIGDIAASEPPKLVLQIIVDGLRADLLERYQQNFSEGGFRFLLDHGVVFENAHYGHANTETIVGHSTLATGAHPSEHGMTGNVWFDSDTGELSYNIEDPEAPLLPSREVAARAQQVDPAQQLARSSGRSPRALLVPTVSDTLALHTAGQAKVFGISGKDRSAVAMAGQIGKAFWMSVDTGDFVTSRYYYDQYPQWVADWNRQRRAETFGGKQWALLLERSQYLLRDQDDRPYETDLGGYGRTFPHRYSEAGDRLFVTQLIASPRGDQLLAEFARALIAAEGLGQDAVPDFLSVSFSGVDAVNHFFGPASLENEDAVLQLDRTLAKLVAYIEQAVGLQDTLIVLSADHGMAEMPEYLASLGYEAGRIGREEIIDIANQLGKQRFGIDDIARFFYRPYLYLDETKITAAGQSIAEVEQTIASAVAAHPGIASAVPRQGLSSLENTRVLRQISNNTHPQRSGHIYVVQKPYWFMFESGPVAAMHGSPWRYDTHVPLIWVGKDLIGKRISREVGMVDVAPTMARLLGMTPPAASQGSALREVFDR